MMADWNEEIWDDYIEYLEEQEEIKKKIQDEERKQFDNELKERDNELKEKDNELKEKEKILKKREKDFIINMINNNIDNETISKITNLSIEEIIEIKNSL